MAPLRVAVTGANGLLGQHLVNLLIQKEYAVLAMGKGPSRLPAFKNPLYTYENVDICQATSLQEAFLFAKPDLVIHAAAMTQVDDCEAQPEKCFEVNVSGTDNVPACAEKCGNQLIYISSDFVFDGKKGDYTENDELNPVNCYGISKMKAENIIKASRVPWAIVRTCLVYGISAGMSRTNIVSWVKEKLEKGESIRVVDDQVRTPTYVNDLSIGISLIIEKGAHGIFHISGKERLTPCDMALATADFFGLDKCLIERVNASVFIQAARRPLLTGFDIRKAEKELGFEPVVLSQGLNKMFTHRG